MPAPARGFRPGCPGAHAEPGRGRSHGAGMDRRSVGTAGAGLCASACAGGIRRVPFAGGVGNRRGAGDGTRPAVAGGHGRCHVVGRVAVSGAERPGRSRRGPHARRRSHRPLRVHGGGCPAYPGADSRGGASSSLGRNRHAHGLRGGRVSWSLPVFGAPAGNGGRGPTSCRWLGRRRLPAACAGQPEPRGRGLP